ncbi:uncharacterized protein LOC144919369 [Branchiostoma floridae x Branchiostoma belcheri]
MPGLLFVTVHVCVLMLGARVTAAPTRPPRAVEYTCPPGRVWDPFNQDCPSCSVCYEYPNMEMCKNNACPGPTTPAAGQTRALPVQATTDSSGNDSGCHSISPISDVHCVVLHVQSYMKSAL